MSPTTFFDMPLEIQDKIYRMKEELDIRDYFQTHVMDNLKNREAYYERKYEGVITTNCNFHAKRFNTIRETRMEGMSMMGYIINERGALQEGYADGLETIHNQYVGGDSNQKVYWKWIKYDTWGYNAGEIRFDNNGYLESPFNSRSAQ